MPITNNQPSTNTNIISLNGSAIIIGDNIIIDVRVDPDRPKFIKVGITAPHDVKILRSELITDGKGE